MPGGRWRIWSAFLSMVGAIVFIVVASHHH
jgi:hypothetical protein